MAADLRKLDLPWANLLVWGFVILFVGFTYIHLPLEEKSI